MPKYPFLTDQWVEEAKRIREEYRGRMPSGVQAVRMNQVVTDVPFGTGTLDAHLDSSSGEVEMDLGHLPNPDLTITLDYQTARAIFVEGSSQTAMEAFMAGRIRVQGDISKLMAMQGAAPDPSAMELAARIKDITV